jgi:hypothetical protein
MGFGCRQQKILRHDGRKRGVGIIVRLKDTGSIYPALDRKGKFTITGNKRLARTAVLVPDLVRCQAPDTRGGSCSAGTVQEDYLALAAFSFSPADAFKGYFCAPDGFEHRRIHRYGNRYIKGMKEYAGSIRHTLPRGA